LQCSDPFRREPRPIVPYWRGHAARPSITFGKGPTGSAPNRNICPLTSTAPHLPLLDRGCPRRRGSVRRDGPLHRCNRAPIDPPRATDAEAVRRRVADCAQGAEEDSRRSGVAIAEPSEPAASSHVHRFERSRLAERESGVAVGRSSRLSVTPERLGFFTSLDLSRGVLKICVFNRQTASLHAPRFRPLAARWSYRNFRTPAAMELRHANDSGRRHAL
jgi:hypothetical protein